MFDVDQFLANVNKIQGAHDMLREAAKQFRQLGDTGHAVMADRHADELETIGAQPQVTQTETDAAFDKLKAQYDQLVSSHFNEGYKKGYSHATD